MIQPDAIHNPVPNEAIFGIFAEAGRMNEGSRELFAQLQIARDNYCSAIGETLASMTTQNGGKYDDSPEAWAEVEAAKRALDPISERAEVVDKYFEDMRHKVEDVLKGCRVVASVLSGRTGLLLQNNFRNPLFPVGYTHGLVIGRIIRADPRFNELQMAPLRADIMHRNRIFHLPVVRKNGEGIFEPAVRLHYVGKQPVTKPVEYIETWSD